MGNYGYASIFVGGDLYPHMKSHPRLEILKQKNPKETYDQKQWDLNIASFLDEISDLEANGYHLGEFTHLKELAKFMENHYPGEPLYGYSNQARDSEFSRLTHYCRYLGLHYRMYGGESYNNDCRFIEADGLSFDRTIMSALSEDKPAISESELRALMVDHLINDADINRFIQSVDMNFGNGILNVPSLIINL